MIVNMSETDWELLLRYRRNQAEEAFAELVRRHVNLVYSAALRQVRAPQLAEEIAQSVFSDLARQTDRLRADTVLAAWLHQVTRRTAIDVVRREARRQLREQIATEMNALNTPDASWTQIEPLLDEAVSALDDADRAAVVLRYFENKSLREVGQQLGVSDDAAQKRVSRAVERLREFFAKRGVAAGASGLAAVISANAVQAAPVGLALTLASAAGLSGASLTATAAVTTKAIAMTTFQKTIVAAALTIVAGAGLYEAWQTSRRQHEVQAFQRQEASLREQLQQLHQTLAAATNQIAALSADNQRLNRNTTELLKLRNEVGRWRDNAQELARLHNGATNDPAVAEAVAWRERVSRLKQHLERNPGLGIPELQLATTQDWLDAARRQLDTEEDYRRAISGLRTRLEGRFANDLQSALKKYLDANNQEFPTDLLQLQPYFQAPVDEAILQRYAILPKEQIPNLGMGGKYIISPAVPVDAELDGRVGIGPNGWGTVGADAWNSPIDAAIKTLDPVMKAYAAANSGREPAKPEELLPYLETPEQRAAYERGLKFLESAKRYDKE